METCNDKCLQCKRKTCIKEVIHIVVLMILIASTASAYTISRNRIIQVGAGTNQTLNMAAVMARQSILMPNITSLTIGKDKIELIRDCHSMEGSGAYQGGYADACDWIRDLLGLKTSQFRSRPAFTLEGKAPLGGQMSITFPIYTDGTFRMNLSRYKYEFYRNNTMTFVNGRFDFPLNCTVMQDNETNITSYNRTTYAFNLFRDNRTSPDEMRIYQK